MSETAVAVNPKGIFNRRTKGQRLDPVKVQVERGRIQFFAQVLGETDPIHLDLASARAKGFPDVVAPPSYFTVIDAASNEERRRRGEPAVATLVNCDFRYLLHGDETYEYLGPIFAGDEVTLTTTIADFYDKKGGDMEFVTFVSVLEHVTRGVLVRATRNLLHRLA
ncbi:MAG: MaoC family dehydratase N-terminal domain-containing protein [Devosia sp.]|nr:MaoC family dehydratase N-terminal domain-containing protein [Devosia sp.]